MGALPLSDIAVTPRPEAALGGAFDGERYLLGLQLDGQSNAVQFVSATTGLPEGAPIPIPGAFGMPPDVAYGSNLFLVAWAGFDGAVHGQLVTTNGLLQGSSFALSTTNVAAADFGTCRVAFGGGRFLVAWEDTRVSSGGDTDVFGQGVSTMGTLLGSNFPISGTDDGDDSNLSIGFDGKNFLVVYSSEVREFMYDGEDVYGRFVSPQSGPLGSPFVIDANDIPSSNPTATVFDGERYAVLFHESISLTNAESWQIYGRFVSTNGAVVGNRILISGSETVAAQFPSLGWNGSHFLVALREGDPDHWEEGAPESEFAFLDTNAIIRARWYDSAFQPVSSWLEVAGDFGDNEAVLGTLMLPYETGFVIGIQTISTNWIPVNVYGAIIEASFSSLSGDDFNDNSKDLSKWGGDIYFGTNTAAVLSETNGRLEFTKPAGVYCDGVLRPWTKTMGSYTQDWEAAVDVYLGDIALPAGNDEWININLVVSRLGDTNMTHAVPLSLDLYRDGATVYRGYELTPMFNGAEVYIGYLSTTNHSGRLQLCFAASTKIISAYCNGQLLGQVDVDGVGSNWGMTNGSAFVFSVVGSTGSESLGVSSGQVFTDNFELLGTVSATGLSQFGSVTIWRSLEVNTRALFEVDISAPSGKTITVTVPTTPATVYDVTEDEFAPGEYEYYINTLTNSLDVLNAQYPQGDYVLRLYADTNKTILEETLVVSFGTGASLPFPEVYPSLTQPVPFGSTVVAESDQTYLWNAYTGTPGTATHMTLEITGTDEADEYLAEYDAAINGSASYTPPTVPLGDYDLELSFFFRQNTQTPGGTLVECANERYSKYALTVTNPVYELSATSGPYAGGNTVTISGGTLGTVTNVLVGGVVATIVDSGDNWVTITIPVLGSAGVKEIVIQTSDHGDITLPNAYMVNPAGFIWADKQVAIGAGAGHSLGLKSDGSVVGWGYNYQDQTNVPSPNADFVAVAGGGYHSLGLKSNGTIVGWGYNEYGQAAVPSPNSNFVAVAAGVDHSLGLKADGSITAWGRNFYGQAVVPSPNTDFVAVAGGGLHSLGLKSDGRILAWGYNNYGQTVVPSPNAEFVAVAGGYMHSLGLKADGSILAWGWNNYGQTSVPSPNTDFVAVAGGQYHSLGLKSDGSIVAWGDNGLGQTTVPSPNTDFVAIAGGHRHSLGLKSDGRIVVWGYNVYGQTSVPSPNANFGLPSGVQPKSGSWVGGYEVVISGKNLGNGSDITNVTLCGVSATIVSQSSTQVVVTAAAGLPGTGDVAVYSASHGVTTKTAGFTYLKTDQMIAFPVIGVQLTTDTVVLSATASSGLPVSFSVLSGPALISNGTNLTFTGAGTVSMVASQAGDAYWNPAPNVTNTFQVFELSMTSGPYGGGNVLTITNNLFGTVTNVLVGGVAATIIGSGDNWVTIMIPVIGYAGVKNIVIQTSSNGDITLAKAYTVNPAGVIGSSYVAAIIGAGHSYSLGLKSDGSIVAWGDNNNGQTNVPSPNTGFVAVSAGYFHSLGLKSDGSIAAWGFNAHGQTDVPSPNTDFVSVSAGCYHSLGLKSDGSMVAWGWNTYGETNVPSPNTDFVAVEAGYLNSFGLKSDGSILAWGNNEYGQTSVPLPNTDFVAVAAGYLHTLGLKFDGHIVAWGDSGDGRTVVPSPNADFVAVAAGNYHSLGLKSDGSIAAWGYNGDGQTTVPVPNSDFVAIAAGDFHSLGLKSDGSIVAWGKNTYGQTTIPSLNADFGLPEGVQPMAGAWQGGYEVVISGMNLGNGSDITNVTLCGVSAAIVSQSSKQIVVTAGAGLPGMGDVVVYSVSYGVTTKIAGFTYLKTDQMITFPAIGAQLAIDTVGLSATASSGLPVSFNVLSGPALISNGTNLTFSGAGTVSVVASQMGDANWNAAANVTNTFHVNFLYQLTVNSGSGSGAYTNGEAVAITADAPLFGMMFAGWMGATQYVADVSAETTSVIMPGEEITLTATYQLIPVEPAFFDSFEATQLNPFWVTSLQNGTIAPSVDRAHAGAQSAKFLAPGGGQKYLFLRHFFERAQHGTVSVWVYDSIQYIYFGMQVKNSALTDWGAAIFNMDWDYGTFYYTPNMNTGEAIKSSVVRSAGWRKFTIRSLKNELVLDVDGQEMYRGPGVEPFDCIQLHLSGPNSGTIYFDEFSFTPEIAGRVADPVFGPAAGIHFTNELVTALSCATEGASIYYTTDGSEPTEESALYDKPLVLTATTTLKARAFKASYYPSETASALFTRAYTLADAVDCRQLLFAIGGDVPWFIQSAMFLQGTNAVQSGAIGDRQSSWMQTSVEGPGTLSFHWKVSCEDDVLDDWDYVAVTVNGVEVARRDGVTEWELVQVPLVAGVNTVRWIYTKDRVVSEGMDCAWVDGVTWTPAPQQTQTTPVPVPHLWLDLYTLVLNGDYETAAFSDDDGDGHEAWEEYVAGTDPDDPESVLRVHIHFENGLPVVTWDPDLGENRRYVVEGRSSLSSGNWEEPAAESNRFFRVRAELP